MAYTYKPYEESDAVKQYRQQLEQTMQQKPGAYESTWQAAQQKAADAVMNRPKFQYDMGTDPLYQQYRQQYTRQAKQGMEDTIGRAAAMNGGYGSSYGQTAGQQVYHSQMQQLNDRLPELYNLALSKYQQEGAELMDRFNLASSMENRDYGRYQDNLAAWQTDRNYAADRYDNERSTDYNLWADSDQREYSRYQDQQKLAQAQVDYLLSIGVEPNAELLATAGYDSQYVAGALTPPQPTVVYASGGGSNSKMTNLQAAMLAKEAEAQGATSSAIKKALQAAGVAKASVETVMKMAEKIDLGGDGKYSSRAPR